MFYLYGCLFFVYEPPCVPGLWSPEDDIRISDLELKMVVSCLMGVTNRIHPGHIEDQPVF